MVRYAQFCPVAKASEVLTQRWTPLIVRELLCGSTRFSEIRRGVPTISTALLTSRLRELVRAGVIERHGTGAATRYELTDAGNELYPIIEALGTWGQRWARSSYGPDELDSSLLMWDVRRFLRPGGLAEGRTTVELRLRVAGAVDRYWLVVDDDDVDLCLVDPRFEVDLLVAGELRALTEVWMGDRTMAGAVAAGQLALTGPRTLVRRFPLWLGQHPVLAAVGPARVTAPSGAPDPPPAGASTSRS